MKVLRPLAPLFGPRHRWGVLLLVFALVFTALTPRFEDATVKAAGRFISHGFNDAYLALSIGGLLWMTYRRRSRPLFLQMFAALGTETVIVQVVQKASFYGFHVLARPSGKDGGFPSGHAAASCVLAYLLTERFPRLWPLWYAVAGAISWSRWQDGAHYPYQVVAGVALGLACAAVLAPRFGREHEPTPTPSPAAP